MAILEDIPGIRASVYSNGYLDEFPDDHVAEWDLKGYTLPPRGRRASAYVRVVDDTEFSIKLDVTAPFRPINDLSFIAEVDGTLVCMTRAKHENMQRMNWGGQIDAYYRRIDASQIISRPLKFCTLTKGSHIPMTMCVIC
jgi:hypothetical protein